MVSPAHLPYCWYHIWLRLKKFEASLSHAPESILKKRVLLKLNNTMEESILRDFSFSFLC